MGAGMKKNVLLVLVGVLVGAMIITIALVLIDRSAQRTEAARAQAQQQLAEEQAPIIRDQQFVSSIRGGVTNLSQESEADIVELGKATCSKLSEGAQGVHIVAALMAKSAFRLDAADHLVNTSIDTYCPEHFAQKG